MRHSINFLRGIAALLTISLAMPFLSACAPHPLPEAESAPAQLYAQRCGQCHRAYDPRSMTSAMWDTQVTLMEGKIRDAGLQPLTAEQRKIIMDYLTRNAGTQ